MTEHAPSIPVAGVLPRNRNVRKDLRMVARNVAAIALTLPFLYPFYFLVVTAFKSNQGYANDQLGLPHPLVFTQFSSAWDSGSLGSALFNSTIAAGVGALVAIVLSAPAADWCARTRSRTKTIVLGTVACIWMIPMIIWIIPMFVELSRAHMTNNLLVLGFIYGVTNTPLGLYLLYAYLADAVPGEIREAAIVSGAKPRHIFFMISLPISLPVLVTIAVLAFVWSWGDVLIAAVLLQSQHDWTVTLSATSFVSRYGVSIQQEAAAAIISMLPMVAIFAVGQRGIVKGLTVGSGK